MLHWFNKDCSSVLEVLAAFLEHIQHSITFLFLTLRGISSALAAHVSQL